MQARAGALVAVVGLVLAGTASAQDPVPPAPPVGNFGGGNVLAPPHDPLGRGSAVIGLRSVAGGKLQLEATIRGSCGGGTFPARTTVAADGTFEAKGTNTRRPQRGVRVRTTYRIAGTLTVTGVDNGSASATTQVRISGQKTLTCKSGTVAFKLRRPGADAGVAGGVASARYYGFTSERRDGPHRGLVLRVSKDGKSLTRALYAATLICNGKEEIPDIIDTPRRSLPIGADGTISDRVKSTFKDAKTITRSDEIFDGTLGSLGAAGSLSITEKTSSRKTGKLLKTCRTGKLSWSAAI
jgi:hypothetical protein